MTGDYKRFNLSALLYLVLALVLTSSAFAQVAITPLRRPAATSPCASCATLTDGGYTLTTSGSGAIASWSTTAPVFTDGSGRPLSRGKPPEPAVTLVELTKAVKKIAFGQLAPANYLQLAASIGLESAGTDEARLLSLLNGCDAEVYDFTKVDNYLQHKAYDAGPNVAWVWKPARKADMGNPADPLRYQQRSTTGIIEPSQYTAELPVRVMQRMAMILADMPDAVFLVSDYETVRPDPFLAVTTRRLLDAGKLWVIERWDEPGFDDSEGLRAAR